MSFAPVDALPWQHVLRTSLFHDSLARGLRECVKALDRREAHLCVLSSSFTDEAEAIPKLIQALCSEHNIPMIKVPDSKKLGEWVGLCKYNQEGKAVKVCQQCLGTDRYCCCLFDPQVVSCSCAVVKNWGEESDARHIIMEHLKTQ